MEEQEDTRTPVKKNVFANFKSYNKEAGTGKVSSAAPPKNSIPNQKITEKQENEKTLLMTNLITIFGVFASIVTFFVVEIQAFKNISNIYWFTYYNLFL